MYFEKLNSLYSEKCVYCGMCLEHCPTYAVTKNESESPRGRISLISALNNGDLEVNVRSLTHINNCVLCLSCQKTCPANVNFQNIMETFRNKNFKNLTRWYEDISKRDAVKKGFAFMDKNELPPKP